MLFHPIVNRIQVRNVEGRVRLFDRKPYASSECGTHVSMKSATLKGGYGFSTAATAPAAPHLHVWEQADPSVVSKHSKPQTVCFGLCYKVIFSDDSRVKVGPRIYERREPASHHPFEGIAVSVGRWREGSVYTTTHQKKSSPPLSTSPG